MNQRWVKHFDSEYSTRLHEQINEWLSRNVHVNIVGISVYPAGSHYGAEVILEYRGDEP